ncbi:hypothetical protein DFJ74DRAFT_144119 [Hyaloraphidium curvatum]|nr:hypothetical protein DFJ74DRAFT_144119 [Hyaloraphidium curvatum]
MKLRRAIQPLHASWFDAPSFTMDEIEPYLLPVLDAVEELFVLYSRKDAPRSPAQRAIVSQKSRVFEIELPLDGKRNATFEFLQAPDRLARSGTTGTVAWCGAILLAHLLALFPVFVRDRTILELGCGIGLLGTYIAQVLGAGRTILTDGDADILKLARENVSRHEKLGAKGRKASPDVDFVQLDWADAPARGDRTWSDLDLIVATDVLYNEHVVPHFVSCLASLCSISRKHEGAVSPPWIVAVELRSELVHELFLEAAMEVFSLWRLDPSLLPEGSECRALLSDPSFVVYCGKLKCDP